jgi:hypothetical protein
VTDLARLYAARQVPRAMLAGPESTHARDIARPVDKSLQDLLLNYRRLSFWPMHFG